MVENDIMSTSRSWVEIELGPVSNQPFYKISTIQSDTGSWDHDNDNEFIADGSALIVGATIGGIVPQGRKGSFSIKDITGVWPDRISDLGRYSADMTKGPGPNLKFSFGWKGLKIGPNNKDYEEGNNHYDSMTGFIENVKFDINEDASITIEIEFVAYSSIVFSDIMAFDWNDISKSDPDDFWKTMLNVMDDVEPTSLDVIAYVCNISRIAELYSDSYPLDPNTFVSFSYSIALQRRKVIVECRSTGISCAKLNGKNNLTSIEFGMPLSTWLNSMLGKVVPSKEDQEKSEINGTVISYERKNDQEVIYKGELWTKIIYDWTVLPDPKSKNVNEEEAKKNLSKWTKEKIRRTNKFIDGPVLYWKSSQENYTYSENERSVIVDTTDYSGRDTGKSVITKKRVLSWQSDLSSYTHLFRLFKDELSEKLNDLKQQDNYDDFLKKLEKYGSLQEMEDDLKEQPGWFGRMFDGINEKDRVGLIKTINDAGGIGSSFQAQSQGISSPKRDQTMSSLLAANSFKVTVEIMGDPDLGTKFQGGNTIIKTDFSFGGEEGYLRRVADANGNTIDIEKENMVDMFSRDWILMNTEHVFSEDGLYTTKLELQGYIPLTTKEEHDAIYKRTKRHSSSTTRHIN